MTSGGTAWSRWILAAVADQRVHAGVGGVGVVVASTVLNMLERNGIAAAEAVDVILGVLVAALLTAGALVLSSVRSEATESVRSR